MTKRRNGFFANIIDTQALFYGDPKNPEQLRIPKALFFHALTVTFGVFVIAGVIFWAFVAPTPVKLEEDIRVVQIDSCFVDVSCEDGNFLRSTYVASKDDVYNDTFLVNGRDTHRCQYKLCLQSLERGDKPLHFILTNAVLDLSGLTGDIAYHVSVITSVEAPDALSKVFFGDAKYSDLNVNMTNGIVYGARMRAESASIHLEFGSFIMTSLFGSLDAFQLSGDVADNNYCVAPMANLQPSSSCVETTVANGTTTVYRCPLYVSFSGANTTAADISHFHVYASSIYVNQVGIFDETNFTAVNTQPRIAGEGMSVQPTISPSTMLRLNRTDRWSTLNTISTRIQGIEVVTPALGALFLHTNKKILMELTPDWVAFNTLFVLRPHYRRMYTTLSHYRCPDDDFIVLAEHAATVTDEINLFTKDFDRRDDKDLEKLVNGHFDLADQYALSQAIFDAVGDTKAIVTLTTPFTEIPQTGDKTPRGLYHPRVYGLDADGDPVLEKLNVTGIAIAILVLQMLVAFSAVVAIAALVCLNRDAILRSYLIIDLRSAMRNAVDYNEPCPYHYFLCTLSTLTWVSFRLVMYIERVAYTALFSGTFERFMFNYFEKSDASLDENRSATHKISRSISLDSIKAQFDRWVSLRFYRNTYRHEEICDVIDSLGGRRVVDEKYVVLGMTKLPSVKKSATFALDLTALQNYFKVTRQDTDAVLVDDIYMRAVVSDPSITEERIVSRLREWKFKVVQRQTNIVLGLRHKAYSREGLLSEDVVSNVVAKIEYCLSATPSYWYLHMVTSGPQPDWKRRFKAVGLGLAEALIVLCLTFLPFLSAFFVTMFLDWEYHRYSTTNSVLTLHELPAAITDIFHRPRTHTWLSTIIGATTIVFFALVWIEPFIVMATYRLVPRMNVEKVVPRIAMAPRLCMSVIIGVCYVILIGFSLWYITSVLIWWVLGAIIEPNTMLVYATAAYTFLYLIYTTWSNWTRLYDHVKMELKARVLEAILNLIRKTPAGEVFAGGMDTASDAIGDVASAAGMGAGSGASQQVSLAGGESSILDSKRAASKFASEGIDTGLVIDLLSEDTAVQRKAVGSIASILGVPECSLLLPLALVTQKRRNVEAAVEGTFDEINIPPRFVPLGIQLAFGAVDLPVSATEVAHSFYALVPQYYDVLVQYDDTIVELVHAGMNRNLQASTLMRAMESVAASQISRILDLQASTINDLINAVHAAHDGNTVRCMHQLASVLVAFQSKVPESPPEAKMLYTLATEFALMSAGRPNNLREIALEAFVGTALSRSPLLDVIEPLFDGSDSARPIMPGVMPKVDANATAEQQREQTAKHAVDVAKYIGRLVMKIAEIEFSLSPEQMNVLRTLWSLLKGDLNRVEALDANFARPKPADTFKEALKVFRGSRTLLLLRGEIMYILSANNVDLGNPKAVDVSRLFDQEEIKRVIEKNRGSLSAQAIGEIEAAAEEMEGVEKDLFKKFRSQTRDGHAYDGLEMWLADQWSAIATVTSFAPTIPEPWCDYEVFERRISLPADALKIVRLGADLIREVIVHVFPGLNVNKLHAKLCHFMRQAEKAKELDTTAAIRGARGLFTGKTAQKMDMEAPLNRFLDEEMSIGGAKVKPRSVLNVIRELCSFVFENQKLESAASAMASRSFSRSALINSLDEDRDMQRAIDAASRVKDKRSVADDVTFTYDMMFRLEKFVEDRSEVIDDTRYDMTGTLARATITARKQYEARIRGALAGAMDSVRAVDKEKHDAEIFAIAEQQGNMEELLEQESGTFVLKTLANADDPNADEDGDLDDAGYAPGDDEPALHSDAEQPAPAGTHAINAAPSSQRPSPAAQAAADTADNKGRRTLYKDVRNELMSIFSVLAQPGEDIRRKQELMASLKQLASILLRHRVVNLEGYGLLIPGGAEDKIQLMDDVIDYYVDRSSRGISYDALAGMFAVSPTVVELVLRPEKAANHLLQDFDVAGLQVLLDVMTLRVPTGDVVNRGLEGALAPFLRRVGIRTGVRSIRRRVQWYSVPGTPSVYYGGELDGGGAGNGAAGTASAGGVAVMHTAGERREADELMTKRAEAVQYMGTLRDAFLFQRHSSIIDDEESILRSLHHTTRGRVQQRKSDAAKKAAEEDASTGEKAETRQALKRESEQRHAGSGNVSAAQKFATTAFGDDVEELLECRRHYSFVAQYLAWLSPDLRNRERVAPSPKVFLKHREVVTKELLEIMRFTTPWLWTRLSNKISEHQAASNMNDVIATPAVNAHPLQPPATPPPEPLEATNGDGTATPPPHSPCEGAGLALPSFLSPVLMELYALLEASKPGFTADAVAQHVDFDLVSRDVFLSGQKMKGRRPPPHGRPVAPPMDGLDDERAEGDRQRFDSSEFTSREETAAEVGSPTVPQKAGDGAAAADGGAPPPASDLINVPAPADDDEAAGPSSPAPPMKRRSTTAGFGGAANILSFAMPEDSEEEASDDDGDANASPLDVVEPDDPQTMEAFAAGSPFMLLRTTVASAIRHVFGVLQGLPPWYPPSFPRALSAFTTAVVQRHRTPIGAIEAIAAVFPMKLRRLIAEVCGLATQRIDTPLLAVADMLRVPVGKLRMLRFFFFPRTAVTLDLSSGSGTSSVKAMARAWKRTKMRGSAIARETKSAVDAANVNAELLEHSNELKWFSLLRAVSESDIFALLRQSHLVPAGIVSIAMMAAPTQTARDMIQHMFPRNTALKELDNDLCRKVGAEMLRRAGDTEDMLPHLSKMMQRVAPTMAPAKHMFVGALHLMRAQYKQAIVELDRVFASAKTAGLIPSAEDLHGSGSAAAGGIDAATVDGVQALYHASVRVGVVVARMILEDGAVNDTDMLLEALVATLDALPSLVNVGPKSLIGKKYPEIAEVVTVVAPFVSALLKDKLKISGPEVLAEDTLEQSISFDKEGAKALARTVGAGSSKALQLRLGGSFYGGMTTAAAGNAGDGGRAMGGLGMRPGSAMDAAMQRTADDILAHATGVDMATINQGVEVAGTLIRLALSGRSDPRWQEISVHTVSLVRQILEAAVDITNKHATLPRTMRHVLQIVKSARKIFTEVDAIASDSKEDAAGVAQTANEAMFTAGAPGASLAVPDAPDAFERSIAESKKVRSDFNDRVGVVLTKAEGLIDLMEELTSQRVQGAGIIVQLLRHAVSMAAPEGETTIVGKASTSKVIVGRQTLLTSEEFSRFQLVISIAEGDFTAIGELIQAAGLEVSAEGLKQLQMVLRTASSMRALANGKFDLSNVSASDILAIITAQIFKELDTNGSGQLSFDEFYVALSRMRLQLSEPEARQWFDELDTNASGTLSFDEFEEAVERVRQKYVNRILSWMNLNKESIYVALILLGIWVGFVLTFIILGAYGFSDGAIFTAVVTGAMPLAGILTSVKEIDVTRYTSIITEWVDTFFANLTTSPSTDNKNNKK